MIKQFNAGRIFKLINETSYLFRKLTLDYPKRLSRRNRRAPASKELYSSVLVNRTHFKIRKPVEIGRKRFSTQSQHRFLKPGEY